MIMESRPAAWFGALSGELFLLHWPVRLLLYRVWPENPVPVTFAVQLVVAAIFSEAQKRILGNKRKAPTQSVKGMDTAPLEKDLPPLPLDSTKPLDNKFFQEKFGASMPTDTVYDHDSPDPFSSVVIGKSQNKVQP